LQERLINNTVKIVIQRPSSSILPLNSRVMLFSDVTCACYHYKLNLK